MISIHSHPEYQFNYFQKARVIDPKDFVHLDLLAQRTDHAAKRIFVNHTDQQKGHSTHA